MKVKDQSKELENLINATSNLSDEVAANLNVTDTPEELEEPEPVFTIDYNSEEKDSKKKAKASIKQLIKAIIPKEYINSQYIIDKINQDAEQLGKLYYQEKMIEVTQRALISSIGQGNLSPRMFEVFTQISKNHSDIAKQISDFQTVLRKSYIDIVLDLKAKFEEENNLNQIGVSSDSPKSIEQKDDSFNRVFVGGRDLVDKLHQAVINKKNPNFQKAQLVSDLQE